MLLINITLTKTTAITKTIVLIMIMIILPPLYKTACNGQHLNQELGVFVCMPLLMATSAFGLLPAF